MPELNTIQLLIVIAPPLLLAITLHEVAHGWMALRCGDTTARSLGRLSLNPIRHIDPVGTLLVPGLLAVFGGFIFGWAKPVPVSYHRLHQPKRDMALVALAGPGSNLVMAIGWVIIMAISLALQHQAAWLGRPLLLMGIYGVNINIMLGVLNMLPIPPLDGSKVLAGFLPDRVGQIMTQIEPYGLIVLLMLLAVGLFDVLMPVVVAIRSFLLSPFF
ncbi:MAG: site-2 protease family protein [Candidatus Contendobacter odensis]|uniref:Site-2 protease family protein n=1 Tax=Candidatus Contendibacter odensensis TaxID=1400860 RepID=A0A2G6PEV6_9GAMM|nr:MAG: site-2 protease family protein [Candidatus Contendobacter odensis]